MSKKNHQGLHGQFLAGKAATVVANQQCAPAAAATFYSANFRQGLGLGGLGGLASSGGPEHEDYVIIKSCFLSKGLALPNTLAKINLLYMKNVGTQWTMVPYLKR